MFQLITVLQGIFIPEPEEPELAGIDTPAKSCRDGEMKFGETERGGDREEAKNGRIRNFDECDLDDEGVRKYSRFGAILWGHGGMCDAIDRVHR